MNDMGPNPHGLSHFFGDFDHPIRPIGPDIEDSIVRFRHKRSSGDNGCHVGNVAEGALLFSIAENGHRFSLKDLIHENADHIPVAVADILIFPISSVPTL
jgi:hypothetical protein